MHMRAHIAPLAVQWAETQPRHQNLMSMRVGLTCVELIRLIVNLKLIVQSVRLVAVAAF